MIRIIDDKHSENNENTVSDLILATIVHVPTNIKQPRLSPQPIALVRHADVDSTGREYQKTPADPRRPITSIEQSIKEFFKSERYSLSTGKPESSISTRPGCQSLMRLLAYTFATRTQWREGQKRAHMYDI